MAKIGIDFGTTVSKVAYVDDKGEARAIEIDGSVKIPTVVFYREGQNEPMAVGQRAYNQYQIARQFPQNCLWIAKDLKRNLSRHGRPTPNPDITYVKAICDFFKYIKRNVELRVFNQEEVTDVCITYPVVFDHTKKELLTQAATMAGFKKVVMLKEPLAAAMGYVNYIQERKDSFFKEEEGNILIFDFGGGTLDLSFVEERYSGFLCSIQPCGDDNCGGENIDRQIYQEWDKLCLSERGHHICNDAAAIDITFLKTDCKDNKELLSDHFRDDINIPLRLDVMAGSEFLEMEVSREQWESFIAPTMEKALSLLRQMQQRIIENKSKIDHVVLIGGSSNISYVSKMIENELGIKPELIETQDVAVANGAALFIKHGVMPIKSYCHICGNELNSTIEICKECNTKNIFYDIRCEELKKKRKSKDGYYR